MTVLDAMGSGGEYRTRKRELITDVSGAPVAEMTVVPPLYVARTVNAQRKTRPLPAAEREAALTSRRGDFPVEGDRRPRLRPLRRDHQPGIGPADRGGAGRRAQRGRTGGRRVRIGAAGPAELAQHAIGVTSATAARCGRDAARCSPCTRRETRLGCTVFGRRRSRWATGWQCARRDASRSPGSD